MAHNQLDYFRSQQRLLLNGQRKPTGRGEMLDLLRHEDFSLPDKEAERIKAEWVEEDKVIGYQLAKKYRAHDQLPPCHDCPPLVLAYCYITGKHCRDFNKWGNTGKRRPTERQREAV